MTKLITRNFKTYNAQQLIEAVTEPANTAYYIFYGKHTPFSGQDSAVPAPLNSDDELFTSAYSNMVGGKRLSESDIKLMIKRNNWTSGTVYDEYNSEVDVYSNSNFYVNVDETTYHHIYKCIYHNNAAQSTDQPRFNDTSADDVYYSTSDGYVWKYMYSIDRATFEKFATNDYIPIIPNANVSGNAVAGAIDMIHVDSGGARYDNYYYGRFNADDLNISGDPTVFNIGKDASATNGFYVDCIVNIVEGTGKGQYRSITDYTAVSTSKQITVNTQFTIPPDITSRYEITPGVRIDGNGTQSINCVARALVNSAAANSIWNVEILNRGARYFKATATALASANVGVTNAASIVVRLSPYGGHGSDVGRELGASAIGISLKLSNTESGTLSVNNDFRTFGLLESPLFANVNIKVYKSDGTVGTDGAFLDNEEFVQYRPTVLTGTVSINTTSSTLVGNSTDFYNALDVGERIIINSGTSHFVVNVAAIANSTQLTMSSNGGFINAAASIVKVKPIATGNISNISAGVLDLTNVDGVIQKGEKLIGLTSRATAYVNTDSDGIKINNIEKTFNTFTQLHRMEYSSITDAFDEDEVVYQVQNAETDPTAYFHSSNNTFLFLTDKFGIFNNGNTVVGNTSGAQATITAQWPGDLVPGSGKVLYVENIAPILRSEAQSETFKIIVEY
jgi:hypothetical protein